MILESVEEIRAQGVTVYPHVVEKAQPLDVSRFTLSPWARWLAMDENGYVWEYQQRPFYRQDGTAWVWPPRAQFRNLGRIDTAGIDWRETLTAVNQTQHSDWMEAHIAAEVAAIDAAVVTVPLAQISIGANAIPADVAAILIATYSASWCVRLMEDMAKALGNDDGAVVWWLSQMTPAALEAVAQQLATADVVRADTLRMALDAAVSARLMADMQEAPMQADVAEAHRLVDLPCSVMMAGTATECVEVAP